MHQALWTPKECDALKAATMNGDVVEAVLIRITQHGPESPVVNLECHGLGVFSLERTQHHPHPFVSVDQHALVPSRSTSSAPTGATAGRSSAA